MKDFTHNLTIAGQYFFAFLTIVFCLPAELFWRLEAGCATLADLLARKRYGIKGEGKAYFKQLSHEIAVSVFQIKDPVLASHQKFAKAPDSPTLEESFEDWEDKSAALAAREEEMGVSSALDDESGDSHEDGEEEPSERSLNS